MGYDHRAIEEKWQKIWENRGTYNVANPESAEDFRVPKFCALDMFPYPSGAGLHVGHPKGFTANDIMARYKHAQGFRVLHAMGWDAFGLPAENYAIKTGIHPAIVTKENIHTFSEQLKKLGFSYDWTREIDTTDPEYYRWTQWIFLKLFEQGLAYEQDLPINYCPSCKTGLANEEVLSDFTCERCGTKVEKRKIRQWVLAITKYADRLLKDVDDLDWPEGIKDMQRNWIGKSEGCEFEMKKTTKKGELSLQKNLGGLNRPAKPSLADSIFGTIPKVNEEEMKGDFSDISFSHATSEDFERILEIRKATDLHTVDFAPEQFFIAKKNDMIVGFVRVAQYGMYHELGALYVDPAYRGKKLGHELLSYAMEMSDGVEFYLDCTKELAPYYERFGCTFLDTPLDFQLEKLRKVWKSYGEDLTDATIRERAIFMKIQKNPQHSIRVYTTRIDTVFGMTYAVIAPDHPNVQDFITEEQGQECEAYIQKSAQISDQDRTADGKEKTGVFTGSYLVNPYNNESVPLWIADYVLGSYGTGAVMAVPAHDERDFAFAKKYNLPIQQSIAYQHAYTGESRVREGLDIVERKIVDIIVENEKGEILLEIEEQENGRHVHFVGGGMEGGESELDTITRELLEETGYSDFEVISPVPLSRSQFLGYRSGRNLSTTGRVFHVILRSENRRESEVDTGKHTLKWVEKDIVEQEITWHGHSRYWKLFYHGEEALTDDGILVDSGDFTGLTSEKAREVLTDFAETQGFGQKKVNYKLRDWLFSRQRYWGEPIPLIHLAKEDLKKIPHIHDITQAIDPEMAYVLKRPPYDGERTAGATCNCSGNIRELVIGGKVVSKIYDGIYGKIVCDYDLPLRLPETERFEPAGDGNSPLTNIPEFVHVQLAKNLSGKRETNTMPQWAGSCWYYLRYMDPHDTRALVAPEIEQYWKSIDSYVGGAEHAVLHLLYARFWHKFLFDIGVVSTTEPFYRLRNQGMILAYAYERENGGLVAVDLVEEKDGKFYEIQTGELVKRVVAKMSKSLKNVVNPDDIIREYGADSLRMYEMYLADFKDSAPWDTTAMIGMRRFLDRVYTLFIEGKEKYAEDDIFAMKTLHKAIQQIGEGIDNYKFNTAIAQLIIVMNTGLPKDEELRDQWKESFLGLLHPFAPHMAEECFEYFQKEQSKKSTHFPKIYFATGNAGKISRAQKTFSPLDTSVVIESFPHLIDTEETGTTPMECALQKLEAYRGIERDAPLVVADTAVYFKDQDFEPTKVRKVVLEKLGKTEHEVSASELARLMQDFYRTIARDAGGKVDFFYKDAFAVLFPDGSVKTGEYTRDYVLTDQIFGELDESVPMRSLYISKITGKSASETTEADYQKEFLMQTQLFAEIFGYKYESLFFASWPKYDDFMLIDDEVTIAVQIGGKLRGTFSFLTGVSQEEVSAVVSADPNIAKWLEGKEIVKEIFIPNKMLSIVVK